MEDVGLRRLAAWLPPALWAGALLLLSAQPSDRLPAVTLWQLDKLVHALLYAALGALTGRALGAGAGPARGRYPRWALAAAALGLAGFAALDEWTQSFTPGRNSSAADAVADLVGAWPGLYAATRYYCRRHGTHPQLRRQAPGHRR